MPTIPPRTCATVTVDPTRVSIRRATLIGGAAVAVLLAAWAGAATWYIVFRDQIAQSFLARQAELRFTYEDRVATLKTQLEREITQSLVERNGFTARVDAIALRQVEIEKRQARLSGLSARIGQSAEPTAPAFEPLAPPSRPETTGSISPAKPAPLDESFGLRLLPEPKPLTEEPKDRLSAVERSLGRMADQQVQLLRGLGLAAATRSSRIRAVLAGTGIDMRRLRPTEGAVGGPLVPLPQGAGGDAFMLTAAGIELGLGELDGWLAVARTMPLGKPLAGQLEQTSPFGYRVDPFTRSPALHTGTDFRAEYGMVVRATAPGRVVSAEYTGGYGNMIEIEHADGLVTRYGHLSGFLVAPGQKVAAGQPIGRAGSTGRSTGAHLHYETRINGEPVNPERFLQAGRQLTQVAGE